MALEVDTLHRERDQLHAHLGFVMRMLEGVRAGDLSHTYATVSSTCAAAENALEAALESVRRAKCECRLTTHQRKLPGPSFDPARVSVRKHPYTELKPWPFWSCPECNCKDHAAVHERKADGSFGDGPIIRCVNCKSTFDTRSSSSVHPAARPASSLPAVGSFAAE